VHHVHLWMLQEHGNALDAHVVATADTDASALRSALKSQLKEAFDLHHITLELETKANQCIQPWLLGTDWKQSFRRKIPPRPCHSGQDRRNSVGRHP
jgi:hypothetical protein